MLDDCGFEGSLRDDNDTRTRTYAIFALAIGLTRQLLSSEAHYIRTKLRIDKDDPSIESIQVLVLSALTCLRDRESKSAYMLLPHTVRILYALPVQCNPSIVSIDQSRGQRKRGDLTVHAIFWIDLRLLDLLSLP